MAPSIRKTSLFHFGPTSLFVVRCVSSDLNSANVNEIIICDMFAIMKEVLVDSFKRLRCTHNKNMSTLSWHSFHLFLSLSIFRILPSVCTLATLPFKYSINSRDLKHIGTLSTKIVITKMSQFWAIFRLEFCGAVFFVVFCFLFNLNWNRIPKWEPWVCNFHIHIILFLYSSSSNA